MKEEENKELTKAGPWEKLWSEGERTSVGWGVKDTENTRNGKKFNKSCDTLKMYSLPLTLLPEIPIKFSFNLIAFGCWTVFLRLQFSAESRPHEAQFGGELQLH